MLEKPSDLSQRIPAQSHNASSVHQDQLISRRKIRRVMRTFFFVDEREFIFFQISTKMIDHTHTLEHGEYGVESIFFFRQDQKKMVNKKPNFLEKNKVKRSNRYSVQKAVLEI
jgi:hypothetical protein